jgi:hypothetical protein
VTERTATEPRAIGPTDRPQLRRGVRGVAWAVAVRDSPAAAPLRPQLGDLRPARVGPLGPFETGWPCRTMLPMEGNLRRFVLVGVAVVVFGACSVAPQPAPGDAVTTPPARGAGSADLVVTIHRSASCGCCHEWEAHLRKHGWVTRIVDEPDINAFKTTRGIPESAWSCHTAFVGGYIVEGHVPIPALEQLLASRPNVDGISLPGMPQGSPGMSGVKTEPFVVVTFDDEAGIDVFGEY